MQIDDVFDNIEAKTGAGAVQVSRTVGFIEPVKDMRDILGGNACAGIFDGERHKAVFLVGADGQPAACVDKLDGIVHQVVNRAEHMVAVAVDDQTVVKIDVHVQFFCVDLLLKRQHDLAQLRGRGRQLYHLIFLSIDFYPACRPQSRRWWSSGS